MNYFDHPYLSNSKLSAFERQLSSRDQYDASGNYKTGQLVDAFTTEAHRANHLDRTVDEYTYTREEWNKGKKMRDVLFADKVCSIIISMSEPQTEIYRDDFEVEWGSLRFTIGAKCKLDFLSKKLNTAIDVKTTAAKTHEVFVAAVHHLDYPRQAAWYMNIAGVDKFLFAGISKEKIPQLFKYWVFRDDEVYKKGFERYNYLASKYIMLNGN